MHLINEGMPQNKNSGTLICYVYFVVVLCFFFKFKFSYLPVGPPKNDISKHIFDNNCEVKQNKASSTSALSGFDILWKEIGG